MVGAAIGSRATVLRLAILGLPPFASFFLFAEEALRAARALAPFPFAADGLGEGRFFLLSDFLAKLRSAGHPLTGGSAPLRARHIYRS
jgi:hypothetical protein